MIRCPSCLRPWDGPRPPAELAKALRNAIRIGALVSQAHLLVAELENVCPNCRFDYAADEIAASHVEVRPYKPRLSIVEPAE